MAEMSGNDGSSGGTGGGTGGAQQATIVFNIDGNEMGKTVVDLLDGQYNTVLGN